MQRQPTDSTNQPAEQVTPVIQKPEIFRPNESDRLVRAKGKTHGFDAERAVRMGKAVLGCLLEEPGLWRDANSLDADHFVLADHRKIFGAIAFLNERGCSADIISVSNQLGETVAHGDLAVLLDGVVPENFKFYVRHLRESVRDRQFQQLLEQLAGASTAEDRGALLDAMRELNMGKSDDQNSIRVYGDIEEVLSVELGYIEPIVSGLFDRGTVNLLTGDPGIGKSFLAQALGVSCAMGSEFLGRTCRKTKVLMLDRENPLALVQKRLRLIAGGPVPNLKIWGGWLNTKRPAIPAQRTDPPALIGDPRLLQMAQAGEGPLLFVFDSFVRFHEADEDSASEMRTVMAQVRSLADAGSTVILLHHRPKAQQTMYRGSSDILAGVDVAFSVEHDDGGLKLVGYKARDSELNTIGIRVDFAKGTFLATDAQTVVAYSDSVELLTAFIRRNPGASKTRIAEQSRLRRVDVLRLLESQEGIAWKSEEGKRKSRLYYPLDQPVPEKTTECIAEPVREPVPSRSSQTSGTGSAIHSHCTEPVGDSPVVSSFPTTSSGGKREPVALGSSKTQVL